MKVYVTVENQNKLKMTFTNYNAFFVIDVNDIVNSFNLNMEMGYSQFLINNHIINLLTKNSKSKKYQGIIYINENLSVENIINLSNYLNRNNKNERSDDLILLDDYDIPKLKSYYKYFNEILYFPTFKKVKILQCHIIKIKK